MSFLIVTGADQKYFGLLQGLLGSLGDMVAHTAVLDLGLTPEQIDQLRAQGVAQVTRFQYPHDYPAHDQVARDFPGFGAMPSATNTSSNGAPNHVAIRLDRMPSMTSNAPNSSGPLIRLMLSMDGESP